MGLSIDSSDDELEEGIVAARAMLAALIGLASEEIADLVDWADHAPLIDNARAAIKLAEAAGITPKED